MNIYAKPGTKVVFDHPECGTKHDKEKAAKFLTVGTTYTVAKTEVHNWHTNVWLEELPDFWFNSQLLPHKLGNLSQP